MPVIEVRNLVKTYQTGFWGVKKTEALRGINLDVNQGEIYGILGPNGAGKTTLINILSTLLMPEAGSVKIFGQDILAHPEIIKNRCNLTSGHSNFVWSLTPPETLTFYAMLYGIPSNKRKQKVDELIHLLELDPYADNQFYDLSTGTKQRLSLAKALLNDPEILFLDEPTRGLDPDIAFKMRTMIQRIHDERGITIILTTHYMPEAEMLCERIAFIKDGRVQVVGTSNELKNQAHVQNLDEAFMELAKN